ncbi:MAG: permease-like cell division protein FtsX [Paludibacter sp.]|jgi:cell division transport system permease protein|nr:permease-like cell division protein FtsX [Paludibacter sp.]
MRRKKRKFSALHLTSTLSMSLVLFLIGLVSLLFFVVRDLSVFVRENITLSVVLNDDTQPENRKRIELFFNNMGYAKQIEYVSKEAALKQYVESLGANPEDFLGYNPLHASLEVKLNARYANPDSVQMIEGKLKRFENINRVVYQKDMINLVNQNVRKISFALLGLALLLLIVSVALIHNTVRLAIYSNRFIINTMKLVGANRWFIRKPYVSQGALNGFFAAIAALIFLALVVVSAFRELGLTAFQIHPFTILAVAIIVIVAGIAITALSSYIAVGRYLRMKTDDIYFA